MAESIGPLEVRTDVRSGGLLGAVLLLLRPGVAGFYAWRAKRGEKFPFPGIPMHGGLMIGAVGRVELLHLADALIEAGEKLRAAVQGEP
jgi:hypothetical protein